MNKKLYIFGVIASSIACVYVVQLSNADPIGSNVKVDKVPAVFDYGTFVEEHHKSYSELETMIKFRLFLTRTMNIFKHNVQFAAKSVKHYLKQNEFTDMTPEELEVYQSKEKDTDFKPVAGSEKFPDLPASRYVEMKKAGKELESQSILGDLEPKQESELDRKLSLTLESLGSGKVADVKGMLDALKSDPKLAKRMESIINVVDNTDSSKQEESIRKKAKQHGVEYRPIVKSNNAKYDMANVRSFSSIGEQSSAGDKKEYRNHAARMMSSSYFADPFAGIDMTDDEFDDDDDDPLMTVGNVIKGAKFIFEALTQRGNEPAEELDEQTQQQRKPEKQVGLKYLIDWRQTGCITPPKSQGKCDSCYAFSTMALMEYFYCTETKELTDFSPQYIVDCGPKTELRGCKGGKISKVGEFIKNYGIELSTMYPYEGRENQCPYDAKNDKEKSNGYLRPKISRWVHFQEIDAWYKYIVRTPLIVGINMPTDFLSYGGGIHSGVDCVSGMVHAMLLVGTGVEDGEKFWLLKNSYSERWGETGYFRLSHNAPMKCFDSAFVVRMKFNE